MNMGMPKIQEHCSFLEEKLKAMGASYGFYEMNATEKSSVQAAFDRVAKELGKARQKGLKSTKGTEVTR